MKKLIAFFVAVWLGIIIIPCAVAVFWGDPLHRETGDIITQIETSSLPDRSLETAGANIDPKKTVSVLDTKTNEVVVMDQFEYLVGVVAAEMPATFQLEALKAQAVAARSYSAYKMENFSNVDAQNGGHTPHADVCTDYTHCKAYIDESDMRKLWGDDYEQYIQKIRGAVSQTDGEILVYGEETVNAVFHSTSSGMTENASDVWGLDVPYLRSVASPGENLSPSYTSRAEFTKEEFLRIIKETYEDIVIPDENLWAFPLSKSASGGVIKADVFGVSIDGAKMRSMFSLKSTHFDMSFETEKIIFDVKGYGHGVGMSQYGANYLAGQGLTYDEILYWYYSGTRIAKR